MAFAQLRSAGVVAIAGLQCLVPFCGSLPVCDRACRGHSRMTGAIPILIYHSVSDDPNPRFPWCTVSRARFSAHAEAIAASGRVPVTVREVAAGIRGERALPERPMAVTFDDGYADTLEAVEELIGRNVPSTVYITTGELDAPGVLSRAAVAELARMPLVQLGAHTVHHPHLDELAEAELEAEVLGSKAGLEDLAQVPIDSFAYPHGSYDRRAREAVIAAGYDSAVGVKNALSHLEDDPFAIARCIVTSETTTSRILGILEGTGLPMAWPRERVQTRGYRAARRVRRRLVRAADAEGSMSRKTPSG